MPHPALSRTEHRPWPLPPGHWTWRQSWCDLLFAHWPVPRLALRAFVPASLDIQEHDGTAWIGVVPFRMEGVMRRPLPNLPWVSAFPELNVRTYVTSGGKPGVWFFSLDAANPLAVWAARRFFHLPYFHASMYVEPTRDGVSYRSERRSHGASAAFAARYAPTSDPYEATAGSLEHFLTERYCLYAAAPDGRLWRGEVHHHPWPLQRATAEIEANTMLRGIVDLPDHPPLLHFARRIDVAIWPIRPTATANEDTNVAATP